MGLMSLTLLATEATGKIHLIRKSLLTLSLESRSKIIFSHLFKCDRGRLQPALSLR